MNTPTEKKALLSSGRRAVVPSCLGAGRMCCRRGEFRRVVSLLVLCVAVGGGFACTTTRAATPVEWPNLDVPPAPPRVIEPAPPVEAAEPEPVADLPPPPSGGASRPRPPRDPAAKPEVKPETPPDPQPVSPIAPAPAPQLRAPGLASGPETAGEIRGILDRAMGMLNNTDYSKLTPARQASYDTAKRFHSEGDKELKAGNFVLAKELAEKAERLAKELQVR